jgi:hypothetical protein
MLTTTKRSLALFALATSFLALAACSSSSTSATPDAGHDAAADSSKQDAPSDSTTVDSTTNDSTAEDSTTADTAPGDAGNDSAPPGDSSPTDGPESDAPITDGGPSDSGSADAIVDGGDSATGTASLTMPSVTPMVGTDATPGLTLVPPFAPDVYDYYVRCGAGTNQLTVSMTASAGATTSLTQPTPSGSAPTQTLAVSVAENQAIVAVATAGAMTTEYWVRCLPHDFPKLQMTVHPDAGTAPPGYYLVGNLQVTASGGYAMVLNGNGVPVWYYAMGAGLGVVDVDNVVSGAISFVASSQTVDENFEIHQLNPASKTTIAPMGYATDTHELRVLANGHYLVLSYPFKSGVDLTGLSIATADGGTDPLGPNSTIQDCAVVEFDGTGAVTSTWLASDHFNPAQVSTLPLTGFGPGATLPDGGTVYDVFHCNAIDVDPANGNLLVSAREMDSIFYVDRPSGKVLWKMGGVNSSLDNATYVAVADPFFRQHDARLQPGWSPTCNGGSGQISMFDDESQKPGPARGVVYDVVVGAPDAGGAACDAGGGGTPGQATVAWQYKGTVSTAATGSFRISPDGSRVIGWGLGGAPDLAFSEVDVNGNDLLDFHFTDGNVTYRAIKVPLTAFDLNVLRSTAGMP